MHAQTPAPQELLDRAEASAQGTLVRYDRTAAELTALTHKYGSAVFNCAFPEQDKAARAARKELVALRTSLETKRKEIKAPFFAVAKEIDEKAKFLESAIIALEKPIDAQIKIEEDRKEALRIEAQRIEHERVEAIKAKIAVISRVRIDALRMTAPQIEAALAAEFDFSEFAEFEAEARSAHEETVSALQSMLQIRMQQEEEQATLKKAQAELLRQAEENKRVAADLKAKQDAELAEERALLAAERAEQAELNAQIAEAKAKSDAIIAEAQAAERQKNMASEIAKARLCNAAPLMLAALKAVNTTPSHLSPELLEQVQQAIIAAEGGAL